MEGIFVAFIAHPHDHTFLNLRIQALQYTVCIIGYSLYSTIYIAGRSLYSTTFYKRHSLYSILPHKSAHICIRASRMGPLPAWAPLGIFTFSKWCLTCHSSTCLSKEPQTPTGVGPPLCPTVAKAKLPSWNCLPKSTNSTWEVDTSIRIDMVNASWTQSQWEPLEDAHLSYRLLMRHFLLHNRPRWQAGPTVS